MRRPQAGRAVLHSLLDRYERNPQSSRRIIERPTLNFASAEERQVLNGTLEAARDAGAVELRFDRDAPHLIASVVLTDPDRLYTHLFRPPASANKATALFSLSRHIPITEIGAALKSHIEQGWNAGERPLTLGPTRVDEAITLLRATDAAFTDLSQMRIPLRTRSARLLGDSKALERAIPKLLAFLKQTGRIEPVLTRDEALRVLGLEKFPQPVLLAGPIAVGGASLKNWVYAGVPPEATDDVIPTSRIASILTVENLESFNRHVRECRGLDDLVVYTGGFPAPAVIAILIRIIEHSNVSAIWHWGDIDRGGVRIGCYLEKALPVPVRPHLMNSDLAAEHGQPLPVDNCSVTIDPSSAFFELAMFLAGPEARSFEQEVLDPKPILSAC